MIGRHEWNLVGVRNGLASDLGSGAVGTDDDSSTNALKLGRGVGSIALVLVDDDGIAFIVMFDGLEQAPDSFGTGAAGALAQPFIEMLAIHHADNAVDR